MTSANSSDPDPDPNCQADSLIVILKELLETFILEELDQSATKKTCKLTAVCMCTKCTVMSANSDSEVKFCLQIYQGLRIDR